MRPLRVLRRSIISAAWALLAVSFPGAPTLAQEHGEGHPSTPEAAEHAEHEFHRHHFSVFLGVTDGEIETEAAVGVESEGGSVVFEDQRAFTVGLDYEYRLNRRWGIGALIDYAGKDFRSWVAGVPIVLHPGGAWKLLVAPGLEDKEVEDVVFLVRAGVMYDFEVGSFTVAPALNVDFVDDEEILVYGFNIGRGF
jgi:hypothetical protein